MKARFSEWVLAGLGGVSLYSKRLWGHELEDGLRLGDLRQSSCDPDTNFTFFKFDTLMDTTDK